MYYDLLLVSLILLAVAVLFVILLVVHFVLRLVVVVCGSRALAHNTDPVANRAFTIYLLGGS